jgi:hypothetical protein
MSDNQREVLAARRVRLFPSVHIKSEREAEQRATLSPRFDLRSISLLRRTL